MKPINVALQKSAEGDLPGTALVEPIRISPPERISIKREAEPTQ